MATTKKKKSALRKVKSLKKASAPHIIVSALAGTGKTTTIVEGLKELKGEGSSFTPSPQQEAIWDAIKLSSADSTVCFVAFNKAIATELKDRVPEGVDAMTMHSMGMKSVLGTYGKLKVDNWRVPNMIADILGKDLREIRKKNATALRASERLVSLCKMNLLEPTEKNLLYLTTHYDIDLNASQDTIFSLVPQVLDRCKAVDEDRCMNFDDMIWLPIINELSVPKYDVLFVDECQDLNPCQQQLALKAGRRLVLVGDRNQAIYAFAGADSKSITNMEDILASKPEGCSVLPLTETRRCGKAIVEEARRFVSDFSAHVNNSAGSITTTKVDQYQKLAVAGDMILCRVNAPLVKECFRFIRNGQKANIKGRDIGVGLVSTVKKMKALDINDLAGKLSDWVDQETNKENAKKNPNEAKLERITDRYECLCYFLEDCRTVEQVIIKIEDMFKDKTVEGIMLSSIHKAKGLEASRVFFLQMKNCPCPHPMAKTVEAKEQELNLCYVAVTRSIHELIYVTD
tara:strand:- start:43005 stop:44549 length:1545 start_codon:yes stop_codon:yes gene_type:complete